MKRGRGKASVQFHDGETVVGKITIELLHGEVTAIPILFKDLIELVNDRAGILIILLLDEEAIIEAERDFGAGFTAAGGKPVGTAFGIAVIIAALISGAAGGLHLILSGTGGESKEREDAENKGDKFFHGNISFH